jgi:hypothetical protein
VVHLAFVFVARLFFIRTNCFCFGARSPNQQSAFCFRKVFVFVGEQEVVCKEECFI